VKVLQNYIALYINSEAKEVLINFYLPDRVTCELPTRIWFGILGPLSDDVSTWGHRVATVIATKINSTADTCAVSSKSNTTNVTTFQTLVVVIWQHKSSNGISVGIGYSIFGTWQQCIECRKAVGLVITTTSCLWVTAVSIHTEYANWGLVSCKHTMNSITPSMCMVHVIYYIIQEYKMTSLSTQ